LRFPEFSGEWNIVNVSDLLEFYSTNSLSWDQLDYNDGDIKNLHYGLIHVGLPTNVDLSKDELPYIKSEYIPKNFTTCKDGDIAFADASEDTNEVAKVIEFVNIDNQDVVCGLHTIHGRDKLDATIIGFKGYAFSSMPFHHQIRRIAQGTKIYSISPKNFSECTIGVPSKAEQQKIADLMAKIDARIATQKKVIEKLQSLIGGIYKSIFADIDCSFRLDEICEIRKGQQVNGTELFEDGEYYVMNGGVEPSGCYDKFNTPANTISISEGGNSCGYVQFNNRPFWSGGHCYTLRNVNLQYNLRFLYHYLKANESEIMKLRIGSGLPNIQKKDLEAYCIPMISFIDQVRISKSLDAVQTKIEQSKDMLALYEKQKRYLLSTIFI
jgi:type I restriction enzyme S subunit